MPLTQLPNNIIWNTWERMTTTSPDPCVSQLVASGSEYSPTLTDNKTGVLESFLPPISVRDCSKVASLQITDDNHAGCCYKVEVTGNLRQWGDGWNNDPLNGLGAGGIWYGSTVYGTLVQGTNRDNACAAGANNPSICPGKIWLDDIYSTSGLGSAGYADRTPGPSPGVWNMAHVVSWGSGGGLYVDTGSWDLSRPFGFTIYVGSNATGSIYVDLFTEILLHTVAISGSGGMYRYGNNIVNAEISGSYTVTYMGSIT